MLRASHKLDPMAGDQPANPDAPLTCRSCSYDLTGLTTNRCPECNTAFDPDDPATFRQLQEVGGGLKEIRVMMVVFASTPYLAWLCMFIAWCCGRVALGHWPVPHHDDPRGIDSSMMVAWLGMGQFMLMVSIVTFAGICVCIFIATVLGRRHPRYVGVTVMIGLGGWGIGLLWIVIGPFRILDWMLD